MAHRLLTEDPATMGTLDLMWALEDASFAVRSKTTIDGQPPEGRLEAVHNEMQRRLERERTLRSTCNAPDCEKNRGHMGAHR